MHIRIFFVVLMLAFSGAGSLRAQDPVKDAAQLQGEWRIEKVVTKLYAQEGNKLLEEKTYTARASMHKINAMVPLGISFNGQDCIIRQRTGLDSGKYEIPARGMLWFQPAVSGLRSKQSPPAFHFTYTYELPQPASLALHMPASNYKDNTRSLAVKLVYTCYYQKKP